MKRYQRFREKETSKITEGLAVLVLVSLGAVGGTLLGYDVGKSVGYEKGKQEVVEQLKEQYFHIDKIKH